MEMNDRTGQPRTDEEITQAIQAVTKTMVTGMSKVPPELFVQLMTIRHGLLELMELRGKIKKLGDMIK